MALILSGDTGPSFVQATAMPTGSIVQTANYLNNTEVQTASSSYIDTGQSTTFTPTSASNKVLVYWNVSGLYKNSSNTYLRLQLVRNGTVLCQLEGAAGYTGDTSENNIGSTALTYLDSPATTSPITYKIQYMNQNGTNWVGINRNGAMSSATFLEIKQ